MRWLLLGWWVFLGCGADDMAKGAPLIIRGQAAAGQGIHTAQDEGPGGFNSRRGRNFAAPPTPAIFASDYKPAIANTVFAIRVAAYAPAADFVSGLIVQVEWSDASHNPLLTTTPLTKTLLANFWMTISTLATVPFNPSTPVAFGRVLVSRAAGASREIVVDSADMVLDRPISVGVPSTSPQTLPQQMWTAISLGLTPLVGLSPGGFGFAVTQGGWYEIEARLTVQAALPGYALVAKAGLLFYTYNAGVGYAVSTTYPSVIEGSAANNVNTPSHEQQNGGVLSRTVVATCRFIAYMDVLDRVQLEGWAKDGTPGAPAALVVTGNANTYLFVRLVSSI